MELASLLRTVDYFRRSPARIGGRSDHKEWLHFCVRKDDLDVLVNFGVSDDESGAGSATERGQLIILVRDGERWVGDAERFWGSAVEVAGGEVYARMGANTMALAPDGAFLIRAGLSSQSVGVDLRLHPETFPSLANNINLGARQNLNWLVVPRLRVQGTLRVGNQTWDLRDALGYHDHNWGHFAWGSDFAWEWGYGAPSDPACDWSFMFVRLSDRAMASTKTQVLTVWRGPNLVRSFRGRQLRVATGDALSPKNVFRVPPVMALVSQGLATEVPGTLRLDAKADEDTFTVELQARHVAQIVVPNDGEIGVTRINEVAAELRVSGRILDEPIQYEGGGLFEVLAP